MTLTLHPLFSEHAVLQHGVPLPVWGQASPGATVAVELAGARAETVADGDGHWQVVMPALRAGGPYALVAASGLIREERHDLLAGDVFLASGQSNMEWALGLCDGGDAAIADAGGDPQIRLFQMPLRTTTAPLDAEAVHWRLPDAASVQGFSGVAWWAGQRLRAHTNRPVGLIQSAWGGTPAEAWISPRTGVLLDDWRARWAGMDEILRQLAEPEPVRAARLATALASIAPDFQAWRATILAADGGEQAGLPTRGIAAGCEVPHPGFWPAPGLAAHDGVRWLSCEIELPPGCDQGDALLRIGSVDNEDTTWWDGHLVGSTGYLDGPDHWNRQRRYRLPASALAPGRHRLVVRVLNYGGRGGFGPDPDGCGVATVAGMIPLPTRWRMQDGAPIAGRPPAYPPEVTQAVAQHLPAALFRAMIAPLAPYPLAGIWWYQGESNADRAAAYGPLLRALIQDWRGWWQVRADGAALPFHIVQLTSFRAPPSGPGEPSTWSAIRAAQEAATALPATTLVAIHDLGDAADIHPRAKRPVGERLADAVLRLGGQHADERGPRVAGCTVSGGSLHVRWHARGALRTRDGGPVRLVEIAGDDGPWQWAEVRLAGQELIASHPSIARPRRIRIGWADNLMGFTLTDASGLPAWPAALEAGG